MRNEQIARMVLAMEVATIIAMCGGTKAIVAANYRVGVKISMRAVQQWKTRGIPSWHWKIVTALSGISADQILYANGLIKDRSGPLASSIAA